MGPWGELGMQAASTAVNTGFGLLLEGHNDRRQLKQQQKLGEQQLRFNKEQMQFGKDIDYQMWLKTNYPEQLKQMKLAGLSPGLMYGGSGAGGATTGGSSGGISGGQAPSGGNEIMGLQLVQAQKELLQAQTAKTIAEKNKTEGVDTQVGQAQAASLTQGVENQKAQQRLTTIQGNIAAIEESMKSESYEDTLDNIYYTARKAGEEMRAMQMANEITGATIGEKMEIIRAELIGIGLSNELKKAQTGLTESCFCIFVFCVMSFLFQELFKACFCVHSCRFAV